jgi:hypothetical protein
MTGIVGLERRIRGLMDDHERLLGVMVVDESDEGYYAIVVRDWEHPSEHVDGRILAERYAYLTKGDGNDGWLTDGQSEGGNGINRRDIHRSGRLAEALTKLYHHVGKVQRGEVNKAIIGSLLEG